MSVTFESNTENILVNGNITVEMFKEATGYDPIQDDLERCNCEHAGTQGHSQCGWNKALNMPVFMVGTGVDSEIMKHWKKRKTNDS